MSALGKSRRSQPGLTANEKRAATSESEHNRVGRSNSQKSGMMFPLCRAAFPRTSGEWIGTCCYPPSSSGIASPLPRRKTVRRKARQQWAQAPRRIPIPAKSCRPIHPSPTGRNDRGQFLEPLREDEVGTQAPPSITMMSVSRQARKSRSDRLMAKTSRMLRRPRQFRRNNGSPPPFRTPRDRPGATRLIRRTP